MKKSKFIFDPRRKMTAKGNGTLYPIFCEHAIPGSKWMGTSEILARVIPLINPIYHQFDIVHHAFFVPDRLVWKNAPNFYSPNYNADSFDPETGINTGQLGEYVFPNFAIQGIGETAADAAMVTDVGVGSLADHLGLQFTDLDGITTKTSARFSALPFRAYQLIYNEWFRDQDLEPPVPFSTDDGFDYGPDQEIFRLRTRSWEKDYFTSARPFPQKGSAQTVSTSVNADGSPGGAILVDEDGVAIGNLLVDTDGSVKSSASPAVSTGANLDTAAGFTIEDLREASAMQRFFEKLSRLGSRYTEFLSGIFGVKSQDSRLQRPEYLGGGRQALVISEVLQNSQSEESPLGTYAGHGISSGKGGFKYFVPEHGYIIVLASIMPRCEYMNCIRKEFLKADAFDFFLPQMAHLGEQPVELMEINGNPEDTYEGVTFGYQERYAEYKFIPSTAHGLFRTDVNLVNFHANRRGTSYVLNKDFIKVSNSDDVERIYALDAVNYDPFLLLINHHFVVIQPVPRHTNPSLM